MDQVMRTFTEKGQAAQQDIERYIAIPPIDRQRKVVSEYLQENEAYRVRILQTIRTFESLSHDQLRFGAQSMEDVFYKKGDVIIAQEDVGDSFFIVEKGLVSVSKKNNVSDPDEVPHELVRLGADSYFGHLALVTDERRSATITAASDVVKCLVMTKAMFVQIKEASEQLSALSRESIGLEVLNSQPNLQHLSLTVKKDLLKAMKTISFPANTYICRQGSVGNTFYIITEGRCRVTITEENGSAREMKALFPGDYFGEMALISADSVRVANVISSGFVQCLCLSRADFSTMLSSAASAIMEQSLARQVENLNSSKKKKRDRRRISGFNEDGVKSASRVAILFHGMGKFMYQCKLFSMYWMMFRRMVLVPETIQQYGPLAASIMLKYESKVSKGTSDDPRIFAIEAIRETALRLLRTKPLRRTEYEHAFILGLLKQKNQLRDEMCKGWPDHKYELLCRRVRLRESVDGLRKVNEVGETGSTAWLIMRGGARLHAQYSDASGRRVYVYEEDLMPGELLHSAALGGMHRRLLETTAITNLEMMEIEHDDFVDAKGNDVYTLSIDEKYRFLENVPLFQGLEAYELYQLAQQLEHDQIRVGTKVLETGKHTDKLCFLLHGRVDMLSNVNRKSVMSVIQKYDYFGESSVLNYFFADPNVKATREQTKHERRLIRNGRNKGDPSLFYELTDAVTGSHAELLVLPKIHFPLLGRVAEKVRDLYYFRAQARLKMSKLLFSEDRKAQELKDKFTAVARLAQQEDNPNAFYETSIPSNSEAQEKEALSTDYPRPASAQEGMANLMSPISTPHNRRPRTAHEGSITASLSHESLQNSARDTSPHLTTKPIGHMLDLHSTPQLLGMASPMAQMRPNTGQAAHFFPALTSAQGDSGVLADTLLARPKTADGGMPPRVRQLEKAKTIAGRFPAEVSDVEDIPSALNGLFNPIGLLGTCKTDKQKSHALKLLKSTYKVRSASELHSRLGKVNQDKKSKLARSVSMSAMNRGARPHTAGGDLPSRASAPSAPDHHHDFLRGSHRLQGGKHYHEILHPTELLRFRPSTNLTRTRKK